MPVVYSDLHPLYKRYLIFLSCPRVPYTIRYDDWYLRDREKKVSDQYAPNGKDIQRILSVGKLDLYWTYHFGFLCGKWRDLKLFFLEV